MVGPFCLCDRYSLNTWARNTFVMGSHIPRVRALGQFLRLAVQGRTLSLCTCSMKGALFHTLPVTWELVVLAYLTSYALPNVGEGFMWRYRRRSTSLSQHYLCALNPHKHWQCTENTERLSDFFEVT